MTLDEYIRSAHGNGAKLARTLGVSASRVSQMAADSSRIEPSRCVAIERATNNAVKRQELRTDWREIWPELPEDWDGKTERRKQVRRAADRKAKGR